MFQVDSLEEALRVLGATLRDRELHYALLAIGGSSLLLLGLVQRPTADLDVVAIRRSGQYSSADPLPDPLIAAISEVGDALGLADRWMNSGPAMLLEFGLPEGFETRIEVRHYGGLELHLPGRLDHICFKLYAATDQGPRSKHFTDLQDLKPADEELRVAAAWAMTHDPSPGFRAELIGALTALGMEISDADLEA